MEKRTLEELDLLDDFLFSTIMNDKTVGEPFTRSLLRIILHKEFGRLKIIPQKFINGNDTMLHGARLDVFVEEQDSVENATVYDIEPELKNRADLIKALPRRVRFYHAKLDADCLESGTGYNRLKNVCIIMISPFDPFNLRRMVYTIQNRCIETLDMPYEDGARTIFLYTKGTEGNPPQELRELLHYMEKTTEQNAVNPDLKQIHGMVMQVKRNREVALAFMKSFEKEQLIREEAREEALEEMQEKINEAERLRSAAEERADEAQQHADEERRLKEAALAEIKKLREELERQNRLSG